MLCLYLGTDRASCHIVEIYHFVKFFYSDTDRVSGGTRIAQEASVHQVSLSNGFHSPWNSFDLPLNYIQLSGCHSTPCSPSVLPPPPPPPMAPLQNSPTPPASTRPPPCTAPPTPPPPASPPSPPPPAHSPPPPQPT